MPVCSRRMGRTQKGSDRPMEIVMGKVVFSQRALLADYEEVFRCYCLQNRGWSMLHKALTLENDMVWREEITVRHIGLLCLSAKALRRYMRELLYAKRCWRQHSGHRLKVYFHPRPAKGILPGGLCYCWRTFICSVNWRFIFPLLRQEMGRIREKKQQEPGFSFVDNMDEVPNGADTRVFCMDDSEDFSVIGRGMDVRGLMNSAAWLLSDLEEIRETFVLLYFPRFPSVDKKLLHRYISQLYLGMKWWEGYAEQNVRVYLNRKDYARLYPVICTEEERLNRKRRMSGFYFIEAGYKSDETDERFVTVKGVASKKELLELYANRLDFVEGLGGFGYNWDAWEECLGDLSWIDEVDIVLYHPELPCLTKEELELYIRALDSLVKRWRLEVEHNLHVYFSRGDEERVVLCLNK